MVPASTAGPVPRPGDAGYASVVRDQLEQAAIRIAEVDARAAPTCAHAFDRPQLEVDPVCLEVRESLACAPRPDETEVAPSRRDPHARHGLGLGAGTMNVQLLHAEPVRKASSLNLYELGPEDIAIERIRAIPVRDRDHAVVDGEPEGYFATSTARDSRITVTFTCPGYSS
jgi:hypothetical protein